MKKLIILFLLLIATHILAIDEYGSVFVKGRIQSINNDDQGNIYYIISDYDYEKYDIYMADSLFSRSRLIAEISMKDIIPIKLKIVQINNDGMIHVRVQSRDLISKENEYEIFDIFIKNDQYALYEKKDFKLNQKLSEEASQMYYGNNNYNIDLSEEINERIHDNESIFYHRYCIQAGDTIAMHEEEQLSNDMTKQIINLYNEKEVIVKTFQNTFLNINVVNSSFDITKDRVYFLHRYNTLCNADRYTRIFVFDHEGNSIIKNQADPRILEIYNALQKDDLSVLDQFLNEQASSNKAISDDEFLSLPEETKKVYLLYEELLSSTDEEHIYKEITIDNKKDYVEIVNRYEIIPQNLSYWKFHNKTSFKQSFPSEENSKKYTINNVRPRVLSTNKVVYLDSENDLLLTLALPISKQELLENLFNITPLMMGSFSIKTNGSMGIAFDTEMKEAKISILRNDIGNMKNYIWKKDKWMRK